MYIIGDIDNKHLTKILRAEGTKRPWVISSPGGDTAVTRGIVDILAQRGDDTVALGEVASAALPIFASGRTRYCYPSTVFTWHQPYAEDSGTLTTDGAVILGEYLVDWYAWANGVLAAACGTRSPNWNLVGRGDGAQFGAERAVELGLVHSILGDCCAKVTEPAGDIIQFPLDSDEPPRD